MRPLGGEQEVTTGEIFSETTCLRTWVGAMAEKNGAADEIFLVDGDPQTRASLAATLARSGYNVTSFSDGETFLEACRGRTPACVLLEALLPDGSGIDILKRLHAE